MHALLRRRCVLLSRRGLPDNISLSNTEEGISGPNPCLQSITINGTQVNYTNYLVRLGCHAWTWEREGGDTLQAVPASQSATRA